MRYKLALSSLCVACLLFGQGASRQKVRVEKTEKVDFSATGTLRFENSTGELNIEGWDEPGVEITTIKSSKDEYSPQDREKAARELDRVRIAAKRDGSELVVTTEFPSHRAFPYTSPLDHVEDFDLEYRVKVPRGAGLIVRHDDGEVNIDGVSGNIQVAARQGLISLLLRGEMPGSIDAKSDLGSVISDFPGNESRRPWPFGHRLIEGGPTATQNLVLKIGFGDILIRRASNPRPPPPVS